jgi:hypothetical protein
VTSHDGFATGTFVRLWRGALETAGDVEAVADLMGCQAADAADKR